MAITFDPEFFLARANRCENLAQPGDALVKQSNRAVVLDLVRIQAPMECGFPRLRQRDIPGLRAFHAFSRTRQGTITFGNQ
jgi:hypothetical protein